MQSFEYEIRPSSHQGKVQYPENFEKKKRHVEVENVSDRKLSLIRTILHLIYQESLDERLQLNQSRYSLQHIEKIIFKYTNEHNN